MPRNAGLSVLQRLDEIRSLFLEAAQLVLEPDQACGRSQRGS